MTTIQHPFEPSQRISLVELLDLAGHEMELIDLDEDSPRSTVDFLNDMVRRMKDQAEKSALVEALTNRFIGD